MKPDWIKVKLITIYHYFKQRKLASSWHSTIFFIIVNYPYDFGIRLTNFETYDLTIALVCRIIFFFKSLFLFISVGSFLPVCIENIFPVFKKNVHGCKSKTTANASLMSSLSINLHKFVQIM